ncbi:MAG TPA: NUDIX hydrolase, partial [Aldersonia sp.]
MLVRDGSAGVEVFLVRRVQGMVFAGGMTVFPGGGVDPADADAEVAWAGPPPSWWAQRFGVDEPRARALVCAAVRETFEECGVLLAGPTHDSIVADTTEFHAARERLEGRELTLSTFLAENDLVLRSDLLRPWSRWITPVGELARRYDTAFFVAVVPEGQLADGATSEADEVAWSTPAAALADRLAERTMLMPPTWAQLTSLSRCADTAAILAAEPEIEPILPEFRDVDGDTVLHFPGMDDFYAGG